MVGKINEIHDKITQSKQNKGWIYNLPVIYIRVYYALLTGLTGLTVNDFCRSSLMKTCRGTHTKKTKMCTHISASHAHYPVVKLLLSFAKPPRGQ